MVILIKYPTLKWHLIAQRLIKQILSLLDWDPSVSNRIWPWLRSATGSLLKSNRITSIQRLRVVSLNFLKIIALIYILWKVFEKTLMLGKIEGGRRRGRQRMRWLDGITDSMDMSLHHRSWEAWGAAVHGLAKSQTRLSDWTELNTTIYFYFSPPGFCAIVFIYFISAYVICFIYIYIMPTICSYYVYFK